VLLLWLPFTSSIFLGQLSIALSFGIIAGLFLLRAGRELIAGFCFGLATLVKLYPGLIFLYLLSQRRWRCCGAFAITVVSGFLLMILSLGGETLLHYVRIIVPDQMHLFSSYPLNISLGSGIRTFFEPTLFSLPPIPAPQIGQIAVGLISGGLILAVTVFSYFHNDSKYTDNLFSLFCITMLLTSPITWYHNCVLLLLPLALLVRGWTLDHASASLSTVLLILILCGVPNQDLLDGLLAFNASNQLPWYVLLGARTGLFGLIWLYWVFWRRLARDAGHASVPSLFESLRLRLLSARTFQ
jgi:hypothetical protein